MAVQTSEEVTKDIRFYRKQGVLTIPKRFVGVLGWERFQNLFMVRTDENKLIIADEKNFLKIKLSENFRVFKARLTGSKQKGGFHFRIMISKELFDLMQLHENGTVTVRMDLDKLMVEKTSAI